jgi:hypothetical protein
LIDPATLYPHDEPVKSIPTATVPPSQENFRFSRMIGRFFLAWRKRARRLALETAEKVRKHVEKTGF